MGTAQSRVWFCTSVGGGVFGESQSLAWRASGWNAHLHYAVTVGDYWRGKSGFFRKIGLRWQMYIGYILMLRREIRRARPGDIFVVVTNPFFLPALAGRWARETGARVVHLVYDLYPDALLYGGGMSLRHPAARFARQTTRAAIARSDATVYLGEQLRRHAESAYGVARRTVVIPVGTDVAGFRGCEPHPRAQAGLRCLYSGHMGLLHDWQTLAGLFRRGLPAGVEVEIAADGPGAVQLKDVLRSEKLDTNGAVVVSGTRGDVAWRSALLAADVALVTMMPGAEKVVMPSKTYSAMAAGQAIMAVCPETSDLAELVRRHDCGWVVAPGDIGSLHRLLSDAATDPSSVLAKRRRAYEAAHRLYSMEATAGQWAQLFAQLGGARCQPRA